MEEAFKYIDIFATKGLEYLLVIGFLVTLIFFWRFLNRTVKPPARSETPEKPDISLFDFFNIVDHLYYHQGHSWVKLEDNDIVSIGIDDFAQKLLGKLNSINLPEVGTQVKQGDNGWQVQVNSKTVDILSPVTGEVIAINERAVKSPEIINHDPYQNGWLLKIKVTKLHSNLSNLLSGRLVRVWLEEVIEKLGEKISADKKIDFGDENLVEKGLAKEIEPENWNLLVKELLLTT